MKQPNEFTSRRDRWQAAPEVTYREGEYIDKLSKNKTQVVVKLIDGEEVRGWIEYYDKDIIRITRSTEPNLFIYKNRVKYLFEDPDARQAQKLATLKLPVRRRHIRKRLICTRHLDLAPGNSRRAGRQIKRHRSALLHDRS
jgi:host factor-I protein